MLLSSTQLLYISQTIYGLMTDIYDREHFYLEYKNLVPNELEPNTGRVTAVFNAIYHELDTIGDHWNHLTNQRKNYTVLEAVLDKMDGVLKELCTNAVIIGYETALHLSDICIADSVYKEHFYPKMKAGEICNHQYSELIIALMNIQTEAIRYGDIKENITQSMICLMQLIDQEYNILTDIAFSHGTALGRGDMNVSVVLSHISTSL